MLGSILCSVVDPQNFNGLRVKPVNHDVRKWMKDDFSRAGLEADSAPLGQGLE